MKKAILLSMVFVFAVSSVFAGPFAPTPMKLTVPGTVKYNFDGKEMVMPVSVSGSGGLGIFCVFTKDKGSSIGKVQNGYLGWHYVNKIDTSIFISPNLELAVGSNQVRWNGKDSDGGVVAPGDYTYYLFAYDNIHQKSFASQWWKTVQHNLGRQIVIRERDSDGKPLANPIVIYTPFGSSAKAKWVIGSDPADSLFKETCYMNPGSNYSVERSPFYDPANMNNIFISGGMKTTVGNSIGIWKYKWVPNGVGEIASTWGDNGYAKFDAKYDNFAGPTSDGQYLYHADNHYHEKVEAIAKFLVFDLDDGAFIRAIDIADWWCDVEEGALGGALNGGPNGMSIRDGKVLLGSHASCLVQLVNPQADNIDDLIIWANQNGDLVMDHNFNPDVKLKWVCNDYLTPPFTTDFEQDANGFVTGAVYGIGAVSFGLLAPDGTGIGYMSFVGDTDSRKYFNVFVDYDSPFDGIYTDNEASVGLKDNPNGATVYPGLMYTPHDSKKGVITNQVGVAEAPSAFSVAQNTPNPFNPSTTISFTLHKAGKTTVEVFNAAGQKVETLLNANLSAGAHSVVWNSARQSAGVYFYTVKSGEASRTMKMTLLK